MAQTAPQTQTGLIRAPIRAAPQNAIGY